jgi:hypothetical protein
MSEKMTIGNKFTYVVIWLTEFGLNFNGYFVIRQHSLGQSLWRQKCPFSGLFTSTFVIDEKHFNSLICGLYYKSFTIVTYDRNDGGQGAYSQYFIFFVTSELAK